MKSRLIERILVVTMLVISIGGIAVLGIWRALGGTPSLDAVRSLAREQRFAQAQDLLDRYLRVHPESVRARLLMAELTTEATNSHPKIALEQLQKIQPDTQKQAALVKFLEGKAQFHLGRYDLSETSWRESLRLDPIVPEAGWALVDLLDKEGRAEEAHRLGMKLHEIETDPVDRVRILLEMCRLDIEVPDPVSQVELFEPLVRQHPEHLPLNIMLGLALTRVNRSEEGLKILEEALKRDPRSPDAWDARLSGLYLASEPDKLFQEFSQLPKELAADPRFAKHQGVIAQNSRDWAQAVRAYSLRLNSSHLTGASATGFASSSVKQAKPPSSSGSTASTRTTKQPTRKCAALTLRGSSQTRLPPSRGMTSISSEAPTTRPSRSSLWAFRRIQSSIAPG